MVSFWDTSAVVALCVHEPRTPRVWELAERDRDLVVWWGTHVECISALSRRLHNGMNAIAERGREELDVLARDWVEVEPAEQLRRSAEQLLWVHPLRAADAFQLAAALHWSGSHPAGAGFVCLDERLREAARLEGFTVLPQP